MQHSEKKALEFYAAKNYPAALRAFVRAEKESLAPRDDLVVLMANCYDALGQKELAIISYKKALKINKESDTAMANLAIVYYEKKDIAKSKKYATKAVQENPYNISAISVLGNIYYQQKKYKEALKYYQKAMDIKRDFYSANFNTASIYFTLKDYKNAYFYLKKTMQFHGEVDEVLNLYASLCMELEKYDEARFALLKLCAKNPHDYWNYNMLSQTYQHLKEYDKALEQGWQAVLISKGEESQQINFGYLLYEITTESPQTDVTLYAAKWLEMFAESPMAYHMGNAILNTAKVSNMSSAFVREIFDVFAQDFESVLMDLDYAVPALMAQILEDLDKSVSLKKMRILDAGCGTGLCGKYLKKYAKFKGLDGVDVSEKMLAQAKEKNLYTNLYNQDLIKFLQAKYGFYDFVNAADVFTYFADLNTLFFLLSSVMRKNARILFSVSENCVDDKDFFLHASGRFLHSKKYVEETLKKYGFVVEKLNRERLRDEGGKPVFGWVVMAQKY